MACGWFAHDIRAYPSTLSHRVALIPTPLALGLISFWLSASAFTLAQPRYALVMKSIFMSFRFVVCIVRWVRSKSQHIESREVNKLSYRKLLPLLKSLATANISLLYSNFFLSLSLSLCCCWRLALCKWIPQIIGLSQLSKMARELR